STLVNTVAMTSGAAGSNTVGVASTAGLVLGTPVSGTGIATGSVITGLTATTITLSQPLSAAASGNLTATGSGWVDLNGKTGITGNLVLNGTPTAANSVQYVAATLWNSSASPATFTGSIQLGIGGQASAPTIGGYGDITLAGNISDGSTLALGWSKVGTNVLTLSGTNTFTGALTVTYGKLALGSAGALGTDLINPVTVGANATLDLNGQTMTTGKTLVLSSTGYSGYGAKNSLAALINSSATAASYAGPIYFGGAGSLGADTLNGGAGDITLTGYISAAGQIDKVGSNTLIFAGDGGALSTQLNLGANGLYIRAGNVKLQGGAMFSSGVGTGNYVAPGSTLTLDNSATALSNRLGGRGLWLNGNLVIKGNAISSVLEQVVGNNTPNLAFGNGTTAGFSTITLDASAGGAVTLQVVGANTAVFNRSVPSTLLIRGDNLGFNKSATFTQANTATLTGSDGGASLTWGLIGQNGVNFGGGGITNTIIMPWIVVDPSGTGSGVGFLTSKNNIAGAYALGTVPGMGTQFVTDLKTTGFQIFNNNNTGTYLLHGSNSILSANATALAGASVFNSLTLKGSAGVTIGAGSGLFLNSGGLLAVSGSDHLIDGTGMLVGGDFRGQGAANLATFGQELIVHAVGSTNLTINPNLYTTGALTKSGTGTLTLGGTSYVTGNTYIEAGTVVLNAGKNTLFTTLTVAPAIGSVAHTSQSTQYLYVSPGATLDLNGNSLAVANVGSPATNTLSYQGGTITNTSTTPATFRFAGAGASNTVNESFTGNLSIQRDNGYTITFVSPSTFTGSASLTSGITTLKDYGTFENASALNINQGGFNWDDTGLSAVSNRLGATTAVNLNGGAINYYPRQGTAGAISVGALNIGVGSAMAYVYPNVGSSGALTFASVSRSTGGTMLFSSANSTGLGAEARIYAGTAPTLTNGIVGGWAIAQGIDPWTSAGVYFGFATYDNASGFVLNNAGASALFAAGANTRIYNNNNTYRLAGNTTTNSLELGGSPQISFFGAGDVLTIQSGGVLGAGSGTYKMIGGSAKPGLEHGHPLAEPWGGRRG
ncbi:MAG: hypothetical protein EBR62_00805, partial [Verrucomicrobia bacterium]|nr:hypothetical protein [Verrucomicrobiota bacterium]